MGKGHGQGREQEGVAGRARKDIADLRRQRRGEGPGETEDQAQPDILGEEAMDDDLPEAGQRAQGRCEPWQFDKKTTTSTAGSTNYYQDSRSRREGHRPRRAQRALQAAAAARTIHLRRNGWRTINQACTHHVTRGPQPSCPFLDLSLSLSCAGAAARTPPPSRSSPLRPSSRVAGHHAGGPQGRRLVWLGARALRAGLTAPDCPESRLLRCNACGITTVRAV